MTAATTAPSLSRRTRASLIRSVLVIALVAGWEFYARFGEATTFVAAPSVVVRTLVNRILIDPAIRQAILITLYEIAIAYGLSIVVGLFLGLAIGWTDFGRRTFFPILLFAHAVPQVVLLPLFVLIIGIGPPLKIVLGFTHGVFPVVVNVMAGMETVNRTYLRGARSMGARRFDLVRYVYFPHMVPAFFTGLRLSMTLTLLGVVLGELYVSTAGVGRYTRLFAETFQPAPLFALIMTLAAVAILLNETVRLGERHFTRWQH